MSLCKKSYFLLLAFFCLLTAVPSVNALPSYGKKAVPVPAGTAQPWGKPLAGGAVKVLLVAPQHTLQDAAELKKRLDVDCRVVPLWDAEHAGYDPIAYGTISSAETDAEVFSRLEKELRQPADVLILANFNISLLPERILSEVLFKVSQGTGLLTAFDRSPVDGPLAAFFDNLQEEADTDSISGGIGECAFPGGLELRQIIRSYVHGKGKIVCLDYPGDFPRRNALVQSPADPYDLESAWEENAWSFVVRAICYAAGRRPEVRIARIEDGAPSGPAEDEIPPDFYPEFIQAMKDSAVSQPSRPFVIRLNKPADKKYNVELQIRRPGSSTRITYEEANAFSKDSEFHIVEVPAGPGPCLFDVWLKDRSGITDWFTALLQVPGWPDFYQLELEKQWLMPNDSLDISAKVRPFANQSRQACLYARATDGFERVVAQSVESVGSDGGTATVRLHFTDLISPLIRLEVYAVEGGPRSFSETELHSAYREVRFLSVRQRLEPPQMELGASLPAPSEYGDLSLLKMLAQEGVRTVHAPAGESTIIRVSEKGLTLLPELEHISVNEALDGKYRVPCLNDPSYRISLEETLKTGTLRHWAGTRGRYSLGNGNVLCATEEAVCRCGYCLEAWHQVLREKYTSLEALNRQWGTHFSEWEQIDTVDVPPVNEQTRTVSYQVDFSTFMDSQFAGFHQWLHEQIRLIDGSAVAGARFFSDTNPSHGYCWPELCRALDFVIADYSPLILEKIASYTAPGNWNGLVLHPSDAGQNGAAFLQIPWQMLTHQIPVLWLEALSGEAEKADGNTWFDVQGSLSEALTAITRTVRQLQDMIAPLILASEKKPPAIAVYDSHPSRHLPKSVSGYNTTFLDSQNAVSACLRRSNRDFAFIDKERLDGLRQDTFSTLILPFCVALDDEETEAIFTFVARGGTVAADVLPGNFDTHGGKRLNNRFASLFGVDQKPDSRQCTELLVTTEDVEGRTRVSGQVEADAGITPDRAVALAKAGDLPVWFISRWEQGNTLLLNHPFRMPVGDFLAEMACLNEFITDSSASSPQQVPTDPGFQGMVYHFRYDSAVIYVILAAPSAPVQPLPLHFTKKDSVYLPLTGTRVAHPHRLKIRLNGGESLALVHLPKDAKPLKIHSTETAAEGQRLEIRLTSDGAEEDPVKRLILLDLLGADQTVIPWYRHVAVLEKGHGASYFPLSLNQQPGRYVVRARDLLTGAVVEKPVKVTSIIN
ncbi:MAG: Beta-galactosidase [Candidatus Hydrogenedentes bacterium ADurb.Bin170]|nr:MAG: Beta-galactosidase [Candidatus Hydrogenedentes bacterium ADurb.Bin170]